MPGKLKAKYIQSLGQKKHRDEEGLFVAEGPKLVAELIGSSRENILEVHAVKEWIKENGHLHKVVMTEVSESGLQKISQLKTPNQVVAVVRKFEATEPITVKGKLSLVLDTIQDPGNLGTIIRIADWFGVEQIICSDDCADVYNPKVVQSTMGSIARVKVFYTELAAWLAQQKDIGIYAAVLDGKDVRQMDILKEGVIVIGNESKGISDEVMGLVNEKITIPKVGNAESLNAAVATGVILSHVK
jgi:RNA methyltransferase, TrmH family